MEKNLRSQVGAVSEQYNSLLSQSGCKNPDYDIYLDPSRGVGFVGKDRLTADIMEDISSRDYEPLLDSLVDMTKCLDRTHRFSSSEFR